MLLALHVNEVHDDDSTHISESELTGNLLRCYLVDFKDIVFLIVGLGSSAAVDINHIESFCRLNHKVGALPHRDNLSK